MAVVVDEYGGGTPGIVTIQDSASPRGCPIDEINEPAKGRRNRIGTVLIKRD